MAKFALAAVVKRGEAVSMSRYVSWLLAILGSIALLYLGRPLLVPFFLAILVAQLLAPIVARLEIYLPRGLSVMLGLGVIVIALMVILGIVSDQILSFQKDAPKLQERLVELTSSIQLFASKRFDVVGLQPAALLRQGVEKLVGASGEVAVATLSLTMTFVTNSVLIAIFAFLMLYYRQHFRTHLTAILTRNGGAFGAAIMDRILDLSQKYVAGLLGVVALVGVLDTIGFLVAGVPFPVFFGLLGALAVLIPYVGIIVVAPVCATMAWALTGAWSMALAVLAIYAVIHFLEGNVLTPLFVGHQVNLNPLTSVLAILIGGELWGPPGMLLFIPLVGMAELALGMVPSAKPLADLLGIVPSDERQKRRRRWVQQGILRKFFRRLFPAGDEVQLP